MELMENNGVDMAETLERSWGEHDLGHFDLTSVNVWSMSGSNGH